MPSRGHPDSSLTRIVLAASAGNALEWYDFSVFGYFAPQIAAAFFPRADPATGLLLTYGTYGVSFLARPVGATVLGGYADRRGRRAALSASILLMTLGTALLVVMPAYASIGRVAPLGILAARLIQGFSAGGEFGGATAYMIEHARRRPGFFGSFQFTSQAVSAMLGSGVGWALTLLLSPAALDAWGFRLPFLFGLLIGPVGFYVRRQLAESPAFDAAGPAEAPLREVLTAHGGRVALAACVIAGGTAGTYLNIYLPTYASRHLHLPASSSFGASFLAASAMLVATPIAASVSDRVGRVRAMLLPALLLCLCAIPAFRLVKAYPSSAMLGAMIVGLTVLRSAYVAPSATLLAEMFPVRVRGAGMSLGYTLGVVAFGGFAQLTLEWLIERTGDVTVPGLYLAATSLISVLALAVIGWRMRLQL